METSINFPAGLPCALREGHSVRHVQPFSRTEMDSGRARQRRRFGSVPSMQRFSWLLSSAQATAFEAWFRDGINDGASWFNMPSRGPLGAVVLVCRFSDMYDGPNLVGKSHWRISAELEVWERPLAPVGWGLFPDYFTSASVIDVALNKKWPEV